MCLILRRILLLIHMITKYRINYKSNHYILLKRLPVNQFLCFVTFYITCLNAIFNYYFIVPILKIQFIRRYIIITFIINIQ